jgi:membrane protein YqaA with SNARE-associated domain
MKWLRRLYDWVLSWAESPYGGLALGVIAFAESSFFPVPPDVLLIALAMGKPRRAWWFAGICSAGSVVGGGFGYLIGLKLYEAVGARVIEFYGLADKYDQVAALYGDYSGWAVAIAGFTPLPYKVFTIAAGAFQVPFGIFLLASLLSRSARFFLVAGLIWRFGPSIKPLIDRYFNVLAILFVVFLVGGFLVVRYLM